MTILEQIVKEKQLIARCEKSLALEKLKRRKADTRRKIELGGLVIKSGLDGFNKSTILGALKHSLNLIEQDKSYINLFEAKGHDLFLK
ncbi:conjugal transfer protein TraD [Legionella pneumophila]|uniref:conjugal transfer protein TraD n=1 Tax=Legionella pneumophila TaxID=446 RepID=UPI00077078D5|nr:conjugal transfer protein TraD [Legionella pneumophila]HAT9047694.1 conjugal transfer protein TraD [Legionella pneumophila subsp. pneumophila]CZJ92393.1 conjugal transfer protein TraD [Legionella pneumophila]CZJ95747.1 conjugal transfer protein TraD [Legionella pneumophila]CZK41162.1 conjugal transfer protein TraD [Legionella pneumophila]CZK44163.1 conjugal transfer protein TraD [Legionella pneumophila]